MKIWANIKIISLWELLRSLCSFFFFYLFVRGLEKQPDLQFKGCLSSFLFFFSHFSTETSKWAWPRHVNTTGKEDLPIVLLFISYVEPVVLRIGLVSLPVHQLDSECVLPLTGHGKNKLIPQPVFTGGISETLQKKVKVQLLLQRESFLHVTML